MPMFRLACGPDVTMTAPAPEGHYAEGACSLEVRWILPGQPDVAVAGWFARPGLETESREDAYLASPDAGGLSVKLRGGQALEVKVFRGSPGVLDQQSGSIRLAPNIPAFDSFDVISALRATGYTLAFG